MDFQRPFYCRFDFLQHKGEAILNSARIVQLIFYTENGFVKFY